MKKTLSQIRREAGAKGNAVIKARANKDPLITMKVRMSDHQALKKAADNTRQTITETLHRIIVSQLDWHLITPTIKG